jgi:hypothetical protein
LFVRFASRSIAFGSHQFGFSSSKIFTYSRIASALGIVPNPLHAFRIARSNRSSPPTDTASDSITSSFAVAKAPCVAWRSNAYKSSLVSSEKNDCPALDEPTRTAAWNLRRAFDRIARRSRQSSSQSAFRLFVGRSRRV